MLAEDYIVEDAAHAEDVADGMGFGGHVFDVDDFRGNVAWSAASHKQVIRVIGDRCQSEVYDYRFLAEYDVVGLEVPMYHVFSCHFGKTAQDTLHDEFPLIDGVLGEVIEPAADGIALHVLQCKVNGVLGLIYALKLH